MNKNLMETIMGAVVLVVAAGFIYIAYKSGNISADEDGYTLSARFDQVDGLGVGSDVRMSGLKVGTVTDQHVDPKTYQAVVSFSVKNDIQLPKDSTAMITSEGLLGGKYMALVPGADEEMLKEGGEVQFTQSSINLEQLLGKFAFGSVDKEKEGKKESGAEDPFGTPPGGKAPAPAGAGNAAPTL